jgi:hypothetical protein
VNLRAGLDDVGKRKFLTLPGLKLRPLGHPVAIPTMLSRLLLRDMLSHLRLGLSSSLFPSDFKMKILYEFLISSIRAMRVYHPSR